MLHADLGWSASSSEPAATAVGERLPYTIELALVAFVPVVALGALVGFLRAHARGPRCASSLPYRRSWAAR